MSKPPGIRTCVGCYQKAQETGLFKFGTGRHGYLHYDEKCWDLALKKNAFARALRRKVTESEIYGYEKTYREQLKEIQAAGNHDNGSRGSR